MAVFVDDMQASYGRMLMCHMIADTTEELLEMADKIGLARKWIQKQGTHQEHFDVCKAKRALAVKHGAQEITLRALATKCYNRRNAMKRNTLMSAVVAGLVFCAAAFASPSSVAAVDPDTEFVISQYISVETAQCTSYTLTVDANGNGGLTGTGCSITGSIPNGVGHSGKLSIDITLTDGTRYQVAGCRLGVYAVRGFRQFNLLCV